MLCGMTNLGVVMRYPQPDGSRHDHGVCGCIIGTVKCSVSSSEAESPVHRWLVAMVNSDRYLMSTTHIEKQEKESALQILLRTPS